MQLVPFKAKCTKPAVHHVSGPAVKSPWIFLVKRNVSKAVTVLIARPSERITNVCPTHCAPVITMDSRMTLGLKLNQLTAMNGEV